MVLIIEAFKLIPPPLQKQTVIRLGIGAVFVILLAALLITVRNTYFWLPCAAAAVFYITSAFMLFKLCISGAYVAVSGVCQEVGFTAVKKRMKYIILQAGDRKVQVSTHGRNKAIPAETPIVLFISKNTPVYERDGLYLIYSYLAIETQVKRQIINK